MLFKRTPRENWQILKEEIVAIINTIDKDVEWSDAGEQKWWLEMMDVQRLIIHTDLKNAESKKS